MSAYSYYSFSSPENYRNSPQQSKWLQATLSDLRKRTTTMKTLLEEENSLSLRSRIHPNKNQEIIQMLEEFNKSYHSIAEECYLLRSKLESLTNSDFTPSSLNTDNFDVHSKSTFGDSEDESHSISPEIIEQDLVEEISGRFLDKSHASEDTWPRINDQITQLVEDNMLQQVELARRNVEKKVIIDRLQSQIEHLKTENRALRAQSSLKYESFAEKSIQLQIPRFRRVFRSKVFAGGY